jgi:ABC-type antimicrobial peptide transport system permease subunit
LATKLFGNDDPVGKRFGMTGIHGDAGAVIVGIAENVKNSGLTTESEPEIYSLRRNLTFDCDSNKFVVILSSVMPAGTVAPRVHSAIASIDPTVPADVQVLDQTVNRLADRPRFETALMTFFACAGLALALVGLYGLMAFLTTQRTHEIGIRMALGATRENILRLITADGLRMVSVGAAIGLTAALAISRLLKALIFNISPADPFTFVLTPTILSLIALIAILIPARTGTRVDPAATLRAE